MAEIATEEPFYMHYDTNKLTINAERLVMVRIMHNIILEKSSASNTELRSQHILED